VFDFHKQVSTYPYPPDLEERKENFHRQAKKQLRLLAKELDLGKCAYDLRTNKGGIAVCGESTLHSDRLYVQVSQGAMGNKNGILIRTCKSRKDYTGGRNNFADLALLNDIPKLAAICKQVLEGTLFMFMP
jgi:hypothetical protein